MNKSATEKVLHYHEATKHHLNRYARSSGFLDWANEPLPFRHYEGANTTRLPFIEKDMQAPYLNLYERTNNDQQAFTIEGIASFLELSLAISAWKKHGSTQWALRINPSSGNLHPTEAYLILPAIEGLADEFGGVFHYNVYLHALETRASFKERFCDNIIEDGFYVALTSVYWRESWKYGERAFRYCNLDIGHALAAISISANLHGWKAQAVNTISDKDIEILLGFDKTRWLPFEHERADILLHVSAANSYPKEPNWNTVVDTFKPLFFTGTPNMLSKNHMEWKIIEDTSEATVKPRTSDNNTYCHFAQWHFAENVGQTLTAPEIIRKRRSAQSYDDKTMLSKENFFYILEKTLPAHTRAPFDVCVGETNIHLLLFLHRIEDIDTGIYIFIREESELTSLKKHFRSDFLWEPVEPTNLPLYVLEKGDFRQKASYMSCHQDIAGKGVFSISMLSKFKKVIEKSPYNYKRLLWEAGMVGQVLYLEAEAKQLSGTGIGCFFDDLIHTLIGLQDNYYQILYNFTVGCAIKEKK
ncbi:MAG: nitroreductase family protein [Candidatus Magnetoovum sp. WYHC-5]|nr:nitroreductase family protein [Candidatus Magnetoovum sp. WYHC-5]